MASLTQLLDVSSATVAPHAANVRLVQHGPTYEADIEFSGALTGRRILHGSACQAVADAAVLSIAIAVDPGAVVRYVGGLPHGVPMTDVVQSFHAGVRVGGDLGSLPAATLGIGLVGGLSLQRLRVDLELDWWQAQTKSPVGNASGGAKVGQLDSSLRACFELLRRRSFDVGPCVSIAAGWSMGKGLRLAAPEKSGGLVLAPLLGLRGRQRSERLFFEAGADVGLSVAHPQYRIDDLPAVGSPSPSWFGRLSLVFGWLWR